MNFYKSYNLYFFQHICDSIFCIYEIKKHACFIMHLNALYSKFKKKKQPKYKKCEWKNCQSGCFIVGFLGDKDFLLV